MTLRLAVMAEHWLVTHRQTDRQGHNIHYASIASHGNKKESRVWHVNHNISSSHFRSSFLFQFLFLCYVLSLNISVLFKFFQFHVVPVSSPVNRNKKTDTLLTASFLGQPGQGGTRKVKPITDFDEATDDAVAVTSAGPYADHLHLAPDR